MINILSRTRVFGGEHIRFTHESDATQCTMTAAIYLPPRQQKGMSPALLAIGFDLHR